MKYLLTLVLLFSFSAFAGEWNSGIGSISPQQKYAIDQAIRNDKAARYNLEQSRPDPRNETSDQRWERLEGERDDYYHSLN